ncbi:Coiled-coil domain-containing protein 25 [Nymphon striatum]|nr:Coiled-coil domain-containing protein 25 [Nymphon striatum]
MVFYFISNVVSPPYQIYMGLDKHENEDLIKWGWPEDVWFHVDKVSSAHVYLRLNPSRNTKQCKARLRVYGDTVVGRFDDHTHASDIGRPEVKNQVLDDVPSSVIEDCAQLVKANSIQGNKMNNVDVVYTMWENLHKTGGMDVGQVGFHKQKEVRTTRVERRVNECVNRLNKTKEEKQPNLRNEREERDRLEREDKKAILKQQNEKEKEEKKMKEELAQQKSYANLMKPENMTSNIDDGNDSDDFM